MSMKSNKKLPHTFSMREFLNYLKPIELRFLLLAKYDLLELELLPL